MSDIAKFSSPRPWSIAVDTNGHDEGGWLIVDATGKTVCVFYFNEGDGVEHHWKHQLNSALIVSLVNKLP